MSHPWTKRLTAGLIALTLATQGVLPAVALADQREVAVQNHTTPSEQARLVSRITIGEVDKPRPGQPLDEKAKVSAQDKATWDIPVIWVRNDLHKGDKIAAEGHTYLPVLAFIVPKEYKVSGASFTVTLSDELTELFGAESVIAVYEASTGITYLIPESLRDLFASATSVNTTRAQSAPEGRASNEATLADIYAAGTARAVLTNAELNWLIDLIINYLQPQAVNLLIDAYPAFREAAETGEIGRQIGLYIYYKNGDKDGLEEHETALPALAYVAGGAKRMGGDLKFAYMVGVDIDSLLKKGADKKPLLDANGYASIVREGEPMQTFQYTIVHEMFHAFMDDYNRTGMSGGTSLTDIETDAKGEFISAEGGKRYDIIGFPVWFMEGSASCNENVYAYRYNNFQIFRRRMGTDGNLGTGGVEPTFARQTILNNYLLAKNHNGTNSYFDLSYCAGTDEAGVKVDNVNSAYVSGYLATLYLSDLAVRHANGQSAVQTANGKTTVDTSVLRSGLDGILKSLHDGATLDDLINTVSPVGADGNPVYANAKSFQDQFIKGVKGADGNYRIDEGSMSFVESYLNYLLSIDNQTPENEHPNGSILYEADANIDMPLDNTARTNADYFKIVGSNEMVESTVLPDEAQIGGGKSDLKKPAPVLEMQDAELAAAAKAPAAEPASPAEESAVPAAPAEGPAV